jgi:cell wall-associated NlpC family hydrolase
VGRAPAAASARPYSAPERAAAVAVSFARAQLGRPWRWGGTGPDGYDCSGLVQAAWRAAGLTLPRTSYRQLDAGPRVDPARPAPGDLVFCHADARHVGLYAGGGRVVQVRRGERVAEVPLAALPVLAAVRPAPLAPLARWP